MYAPYAHRTLIRVASYGAILCPLRVNNGPTYRVASYTYRAEQSDQVRIVERVDSRDRGSILHSCLYCPLLRKFLYISV